MTGNKKMKKILIADDEPSVRQLVKQILKKHYIVLEARDGQESINIALSEKPDIILMDIMMPGMDGLSACNLIKTKEATKAIPVVMLTAIDLELNRKLSTDIMGANGYITKPFSSEVLAGEIKRLLKQPEGNTASASMQS